MEAYKYEATIYETVLDCVHHMGQTQTRIYFPGHGILAFRKNKIDAYLEEEEEIKEATDFINGIENENFKQLEKIELPKTTIDKIVAAGIKFNQSKYEFIYSARTLIDLLE